MILHTIHALNAVLDRVVALAAIYQTISIVEGDVVTLLASFREFAALVIMIAVIRFLLGSVRRFGHLAVHGTQ